MKVRIIALICALLVATPWGSASVAELTSEIAVVGEENWLFYTSVGDGDPIGCYQGANLFNDDELQTIAQNCITQRDFLSAQGKEFVIFIAPNKERIYSEFMPDYYGEPAANYRALQVYQYLKENTDIHVVYPYSELMQAKQDAGVNIYYRTDTHWNNIGAYVGAIALGSELGVEMPLLTDSLISIISGDEYTGDLAQMLGLNDQPEFTEFIYYVVGYDTHDMEVIDWVYDGAFIFHATNADPRKLYIIRDSFSTALAPYIGSQFSDSYYRHRNTYTYDDLSEQDPDIVVFETVERYVGDLMSFSIK